MIENIIKQGMPESVRRRILQAQAERRQKSLSEAEKEVQMYKKALEIEPLNEGCSNNGE